MTAMWQDCVGRVLLKQSSGADPVLHESADVDDAEESQC